jgi:GT2 family glycosyltransferase
MPAAGQPTVRLVVLNYDGGRHVLRCVEHLLALDWPADRLQLVVVDNASTDGSDREVEARFPTVRLVRSPRNVGFPANNLGLDDLAGVDFAGLVNNDAFVTPGYLGPLVAALEGDPGLGAACPRILLAPRFLDLAVATEGWRTPGDDRLLGVRLSGIRLDRDVDADRRTVYGDGWWGPERGDGQEPTFRWSTASALLRLPVADGADPAAGRAGRAEVRLACPRRTTVTLDGGAGPVSVEVGPDPAWYGVALAGAPYDVVNNAGSELVEGGWGRDRGFLQPDRGQFDEPAEVFAWCGAGVLFRTRYLEEVGLFDERFFMYYEDTDLAWRGRARGWRYRYVPDAVVRHLHAATSVEGSAMFNHFVERNRLLMLAKNAPPRYAASAAWRFLLSTASYARRDVLGSLRRGRRPPLGLLRARLRSFLSFLRLLPAVAGERRARRSEVVVHPEAVLGWEVPR